MEKKNISRRKFLNISGIGITLSACPGLLPKFCAALDNRSLQAPKITAGDVISRIKANLGVPWQPVTVDTIKGAGTNDIIVTGITTTFMSTLAVLKKSVEAGNNFILTHEPTFWTHKDLGEGLDADPLYLYKQEYIKENKLFVHRFHDNWHARRPDGIFEGWNKVMGWNTYKYDAVHNAYELPKDTTLENYAKEVMRRLNSDSVRVLGDRKLKIKTINIGSNKVPQGGAPFADVTITYEPDRENNNIEWERDLISSGQKKGFIIVSHNRLEEYGMDNCAMWLRKFISEVPVQFMQSGDPFWRTI